MCKTRDTHFIRFAFLHFINEWCGFSNLCCMFVCVCVCAFEIYKDINTRYVSCDPLKKQSVFSIFPYVLIFPFSSKDLHAFKLCKKKVSREISVFTFPPNIQQDKISSDMKCYGKNEIRHTCHNVGCQISVIYKLISKEFTLS